MFPLIYVEEAVAEHPVTQRVLARFPEATRVTIPRYGAVFNRRNQNFRLQKRRPSLILARKHGELLLPTPPGYGIGQARNFYFSHLLNCVYDCRYCFLQGMYRSAHYVLFVNYEDFLESLAGALRDDPPESCFFSGYDCDSLALEPVTGFAETFLPFFANHPGHWLELRTKSTQIRSLLARKALANVVLAFSFTPAAVATALEHKVPPVARRIEALVKLAQAGWPVGLRFDPLIYTVDFRQQYQGLFQAIFSRLPLDSLHSVSFGPFRLPRDFHRTIARLYPDEPLYATTMEERDGILSYPRQLETELRNFCQEALRRYVPAHTLHPCEF